jgi:pyruvate-formate lyase-activating enzyme
MLTTADHVAVPRPEDAVPHLEDAFHHPEEARIRELFALFDQPNQPQAFQTEFLEKVAADYSRLDQFLSLVPERRPLRNYATSLWEFAHAVDRLQSYPWNISLPIADVCNARCTFCTSWLHGRSLIKLDELERFAEVLRRAMLVGLVGHGEPLSHPEFDRLCDRLQTWLDPLASCYTITNGVFLEKWRDRLRNINLCSYSVSLNAATPETHHEVMGLGPDAFPRIVDSIACLTLQRYASGHRNNVYITMVVTRQNIAEIPDFIRLGNELDVTSVVLRSLLPSSYLPEGLNYHLLPPYDHPDFEALRRSAIDAIADSAVPVQADPAMWSQPIFPADFADRIKREPPIIVPREQALRDRALRRQADSFYNQDPGQLRGRPTDDQDYLDDGTNPLGRTPRFACKAVYYNLHVNELFFRLAPCCYMINVPGHEEVRLRPGMDFMEAWNSPAMVTLRRRLQAGPLYGACKRCPEKW